MVVGLSQGVSDGYTITQEMCKVCRIMSKVRKNFGAQWFCHCAPVLLIENGCHGKNRIQSIVVDASGADGAELGGELLGALRIFGGVG